MGQRAVNSPVIDRTGSPRKGTVSGKSTVRGVATLACLALGLIGVAACAPPASDTGTSVGTGTTAGASAPGAIVPSSSSGPALNSSAPAPGGPVPQPSVTLLPVPPTVRITVKPPQPVPPTAAESDGTMTISGTIFQGAEPVCKLISVQKVIYLLLADDSMQITTGDEATVTGHVEHGIMTHCQQGIPFQVSTIHQSAPAK